MSLEQKTLDELREIETRLKGNLARNPNSQMDRVELKDVQEYIHIREQESVPPDLTRKTAVLNTLYGVTNSYVRGPIGQHREATLNEIEGHLRSARRSGISEVEIRDAIRRGITDPPNAIPERVEGIKRRFLS